MGRGGRGVDDVDEGVAGAVVGDALDVLRQGGGEEGDKRREDCERAHVGVGGSRRQGLVKESLKGWYLQREQMSAGYISKIDKGLSEGLFGYDC